MKTLRHSLPSVLMILFEFAAGIVLFKNPEGFTRTVIRLFGIVVLVIGIVYLFRFLRAKKDGLNLVFTLCISVVSLIVGVIFSFKPDMIIELITAVALVYGIILVISGIYKISWYAQAKKEGFPLPKSSLISGLLAIVLGVIIAVFPKNAAMSVWQVAGIALIVAAVVDLLVLAQAVARK